jgi:hypothetical protein
MDSEPEQAEPAARPTSRMLPGNWNESIPVAVWRFLIQAIRRPAYVSELIDCVSRGS